MTKQTVKIVNAATGQEIIRDMNAEELAQFEIDQAAEQAKLNAEKVITDNKAALLTKLGITADEAKLLFQSSL